MAAYQYEQGGYILTTDKSLLQVEVIHAFLANESYWAKDIPENIVQKSILNSLCFGVYKDKSLVGFTRVVSDYSTFAYLCDVFIVKEHRGRGLSKWMMEKVMGHPELQNLRRWTLGTRDAHELYRRFGFREPDNACNNMEIRIGDIYTRLKEKMLCNIFRLVKKEAQLEWRQKTALGTIFIYVIGTSFLIYLIFQGNITLPTWIALFWIISLFTTVNAVSGTFVKDANEQFYYLRSVATPMEIVFSKIIYNAILITILSLVIYAVMILFFHQGIENKSLFLLTVILGAIGFSNLFTLLSAITARTRNFVLLAILGFPIILPLLLLIVNMSTLSDFAIKQKDIYINLGAIGLLDLITLILSVVLFPYIWRD